MLRNYALQPLGAGGAIEFKWDPETGELAGRDAGRVEELIAEANQAGLVTGDPYPTPYAIEDPHRIPRDMALVLGQYWRLPEELRRAYPAAASVTLPEGTVS